MRGIVKTGRAGEITRLSDVGRVELGAQTYGRSSLISEIPFDTTKFVEQSIHEVYKTLYEAAFLVLIVILVFLQD